MPDLIITLTAQQATRLQSALATPENPTPTIADAKAICVRTLRARVLQHERRVQEAVIADTPFDPT